MMRSNLYDASRSIYGREVSNMQPVAFSYVPAKKRSESRRSNAQSAACVGEHCPDNRRYQSAVQNG
jgi:hypothetical protein